MATTDVSVTEFKGNATNLIKAVKQIDTASKNLDTTLASVLSHLQAIEKGLGNVGNVYNKNVTKKGTFIKGKTDTFVSPSGAAASFSSNRSAAYKQTADEYNKLLQEEIALKKEQVNLEKTISYLRKQQADVVKQEANTREANARAKTDTAKYRLSAEHLAYEAGLGIKHQNLAGWYAEKSLHPDKFLAGAQLHNVRYQTGKAFGTVGNTLSSLGSGGKILGGLFDTIGALVKSPVAGTATAITNLCKGIIDLGKSAGQAFAEIESIKTQLGVVFSNQTQAENVFSQISEYAVHSPFGVQQTSELAVLLKQSGVYASDLMDTLRMLGDTASGNMEKMKRIANNYAQIVSIGKASMLDMRQFAYAGIPIFEAVSKELNVSQQQLRKLISEGKVTSDIVEKVFKNLTGINGIFENATEKGAKTLKARMQNLADARQLAMGAIGEYGVNVGTGTGNDSYVNEIVSLMENMWQHIRDFVNTKNIENSVKVIENRNTRIDELKALIDYLKQNGGTKAEIKEIENQLKEIENKVDPDKERSVLASSFENKVNNYNDLAKAFEESGLMKDMKDLWEKLGYGQKDMFSLRDYQTVADMFGLDHVSDTITELIKSINGLQRITEEERKAEREKLLLNAQQLAFDQASKRAETSGSLNSSFQELLSIYRESDEYKEKEEEKRQKTLEEAKEILKKIAVNTDETGRFDLSGYKGSASEFYSYVQRGAYSPGRKLDVVPGRSTEMKQEDKEILLSQLRYLSKEIMKSYGGLGVSGYVRSAFGEDVLNRMENLTPDAFFDSFSSYYERMEKALASMEENTRSLQESQRKAINSQTDMFTQLLPLMLSTLEAETGGKDANVKEKDKVGQEFIPLWKRILAQATGLSAEGITNTSQTLSNYRDDMAVRSLAAGVMSAAVKTMDISAAMKLAKATNRVAQLQGTSFEVVQIDWKSTREAVKNFSLQLSASTEIISAYKNALQDEYNTYVSLVSAGYTTAESQDLKNQKYISGEKYTRLMASAGSQLVNAFGENLKTAEGKDVWLRDDGKFYDAEKEGNEVAVENLIVTENLWEIIKKTLPKIEKELHDANVAEVRNKAYENALKEIKGIQLASRSLDYSSAEGRRLSTYILNNTEDFLSVFDSALKVAKNRYNFNGEYDSEHKFLETMSDNDILATALQGKESEYAEQISDIISRAIEIAKADLGLLTENSGYQNTLGLASQNEKLTQISESLQKMQEYQNKASNLTPGEYGGWRGFRNQALSALGVHTANFDMEDLYVSAARAGYKSDRVDLSQWEGTTMKDEHLLEYIDEADRKAIALEYHLQEIRNQFDQIGASVLNAMNEMGKGAWLQPFKSFGQYVGEGKGGLGDWVKELQAGGDAADKLKSDMKALAADMLESIGASMADAGFKIAAMGAMDHSYGLVAGGLALAAAGGFASGLGGALRESEQTKSKSDKEAEKLENLKNDLTKLLEQARTDALYYENNLRHQTALGINREFSYKSVHDAVITPQGIVETDPKDFLIATKTPQNFIGGGGVTVQPVINCNVVNNSNAKVRQEQSQNADGSIDIITIIEDVASEFISSPRSDDAFAARDYRIRGKQTVM